MTNIIHSRATSLATSSRELNCNRELKGAEATESRVRNKRQIDSEWWDRRDSKGAHLVLKGGCQVSSEQQNNGGLCAIT